MTVRWICEECGKKHGARIPELATWHHGKCDVCRLDASVTSGRKYGVREIQEDEDGDSDED